MKKEVWFPCPDCRLHKSAVDAQKCTHNPQDRRFNFPEIRLRGPNKRRRAPGPTVDDEYQFAGPASPASPTLSLDLPVQPRSFRAYPTPFSQDQPSVNKQHFNDSPLPPLILRAETPAPFCSLKAAACNPTERDMSVTSVLGRTIRMIDNAARNASMRQRVPLLGLEAEENENGMPGPSSGPNRGRGEESPTPDFTIFVPETPRQDSTRLRGIVRSIEIDDPAQQDEQQTDRTNVLEALRDATALIPRLRQRLELARIDKGIVEQELADVRAQHAATDFDEILADKERSRVRAWSLAALLLVLMVAYALWSWYMRPEWVYIRRRRMERFGL